MHISLYYNMMCQKLDLFYIFNSGAKSLSYFFIIFQKGKILTTRLISHELCWFMNGILSCPNRQFRMHFCIIAICTTLDYYTYKRFLFERMNNTNFWKQLQLTFKCIYIFASCVQKTKESNIWIINLHNLVRLKLSTST